MTKASNQEMAFVKLGDVNGAVEIVVFPKLYARTHDLWHDDMVVIVGAGSTKRKTGSLSWLMRQHR